jgi:hypothetical protein
MGGMHHPVFGLFVVPAYKLILLNLTWEMVSGAGLTMSFF